MEHKYKLTIAVLTMNRANQLKNAIESCLASVLPTKTQFLIVDNASTDNTRETVEKIRETIPYDLVYHRETENRGVGGGRNLCFDMAEGEYIYFLDDDAEIATECQKVFFVKPIRILDENPKIATYTTEINDVVFGQRTQALAKGISFSGLHCIYTFHGGTVFIRRNSFSSPLFMNIMYGNEETTLSMDAMDRGFYNVFDSLIFINHYPQNKWEGNRLNQLKLQGIQTIYNMKRLQYPFVFRPLLYLAYVRRLRLYGGGNEEFIRSCKEKSKDFLKNNKVKKIKIKTVLKCYKEFGLTVF